MLEMAAVVLAVVGALVFVMRMDDDPTRWGARTDGTGGGRHRAGRGVASPVADAVADPAPARARAD
ncbi:hypothetical protein GCM10027194_19430 [Thalassiella azotivora]